VCNRALLARELMALAYVKPYVKRNETDAANAEAIAEAVSWQTMRFVPVSHRIGYQSSVVDCPRPASSRTSAFDLRQAASRS
jgi:hypothetical protein